MKKIYSYVLMVAALLIGTNAWADMHATLVDGVDEAKVSKDGGTTWMYATHLKEAFDYVAPGETAKIVLLKSIADQNEAITMPTLPSNNRASIDLPHIAGQNITLDLNGNDITTATKYVTPFRILKGSLDIEGSGTIIKTHVNTKFDKRKTTNQNDSIVGMGEGDFYGSAVIAIAGTQDSLAANWSVLTIGENVTLSIAEEKPEGSLLKAKTIAITNFASLGYTGEGRDFLTYQASANSDKNLDVSHADQLVPKFGYTTRAVGGYYTNNKWTTKLWAGNTDDYGTIEGVSDKIAEYKSSLPMGCGALSGVSNTYYYGILQGCAFGVKVTIKGKVYGTMYAIHVHGNINQTPNCLESTSTRHLSAAPYFTHQFPYVKIEKTAIVQASEEGGCIGVYSAGYSVMDIEGSVNGATGVYMKSGNIVLKDANVWSTYSGNDVNWGTANDGGVHGAGGSAIVTESSNAYAGGMSMTVQGDTKITGDGGYAIFDQTTVTATDNEDNKTTTTSIKIEGGTIESGNQGAIAITQGAVDVTSIAGGNVEGTSVNVVEKPGTDQETITPVVISNFIPEGTHTTVVKDGNKDIVVVSKGGEPDTKTTLDAIIAAYTAWVNGGKQGEAPSVKATGTLGDLEQNLELKELEINETTSQTLTIKAGYTLTVGRVILGTNAQIIVEAGAKFIVTGSDGIVAPKVSNIVLQTSGSKQAEFLFNPLVSSNKHPNATIEMQAKVGKLTVGTAEYREWHRFAVPVLEIKEFGKNPNWSTYLYAWDYVNDDWYKPSSPLEIMKPFEGFTLSPVNDYGDITYTFKGQLVGNDNHNLKFVKEGFNFFGNSYTAYMSVEKLIDQLTEDGSDFEPTVWTWYSNHYHAVPLKALEENPAAFNDNQKQIKPMQTFILRLVDANEAETELNYNDAIWGNPRYASLIPNAAPARRAARNDNTFMRIILSAGEDNADDVMFMEQSKFSDAIDKGYDASKFMNEQGVNIFATVDGSNFSAVATDNVEGKMLSIRTANEATYTLSFSNVKGAEYAIRDNVTNQVIAIEEGASYEFAAQPNSVIENRFEIIPIAKVPTAIENAEVMVNKKGIYTITGQYLGEDFEALPAGVYVVNGVKIVK